MLEFMQVSVDEGIKNSNVRVVIVPKESKKVC